MKILVTGAAGFIGSTVVRQLSSLGHDVVAVDCFLDALYPAAPKILNWESYKQLKNVELVEHDLRNPLNAKFFSGVNAIINEAGMPGLMNSWSDFQVYSSCNIEVTEQLCRAAVNAGVEQFVQISTSSVYGENAVGDEQRQTLPVSPYGVTKLAAEELVKTYNRSKGLPFTILRYFSVYGPGQRPDMAYHKLIKAALTGETITIFGDGNQTRTNTYVGDCATATINAAIMKGDGETYNISGLVPHSLLEAVSIIEQATGKSIRKVFAPVRPGDQRHTAGDASKAQQALGYEQTVSLKEGLTLQAEWQQGLLSIS